MGATQGEKEGMEALDNSLDIKCAYNNVYMTVLLQIGKFSFDSTAIFKTIMSIYTVNTLT